MKWAREKAKTTDKVTVKEVKTILKKAIDSVKCLDPGKKGPYHHIIDAEFHDRLGFSEDTLLRVPYSKILKGENKIITQSQPTEGLQVRPEYILPEPQPVLPPQPNIIEEIDLGEMGLVEPTSELTEGKQLDELIAESIASIQLDSKSGSGGGSEQETIIIEGETVEESGSGGGSEQENTQSERQRSAS